MFQQNIKLRSKSDSPTVDDLNEKRSLEKFNSQSFTDSPNILARKLRGNRFDFTNLIRTCSPMQKKQRENSNSNQQSDIDITLKFCEKISSPFNSNRTLRNAYDERLNSPKRNSEEKKESFNHGSN